MNFMKNIDYLKTDKDRLLYYIGTGLLIVAVIEVTFFPFIINRYFPALFIPLLYHKTVVGIIYFLAFVSYAFSAKYYRRQLATVFLLFVFYWLFEFFANIAAIF